MRTSFKLTAAAALMAMGFAAQAASVTLSGNVSTGLVYGHTEALSDATGELSAKSDNLSMESGWFGDSNVVLSGEEELGNGLTVGFTLEAGYLSDTGEMDGSLFEAQSYLSIGNDFFTVAAGNFGFLSSGGGDFEMVSAFSPFGTFMGTNGMGAFKKTLDAASGNSMVLQVRPVEGLTVALMGSMGDDSKTNWNQRGAYYGLGLGYENGPVAGVFTVEGFEDAKDDGDLDRDNATIVYTIGASYDFEAVKPMFLYQYVDDDTYKSHSAMLGLTAPIGEGTLMANAQYYKTDAKDSDDKGSAVMLGVGYEYPFSKRTSVFGGVSWAQGDDAYDKNSAYSLSTDDQEFQAAVNGYTIGFGLKHAF